MALNATTTGDPYVANVQEWVNDTYSGRTGYTEITVNGQVGWTTIYALLHALQIELGITNTANNFGPSTISLFNSRFPNGVQQQTDGDTSSDNIYGIIQGALICKGYDIGANTPTCHFYNGTGTAIRNLKSDAGLTDTTSTVTLNIMKALMSMDYFYSYDTSERTQNIIAMQRYLNRNYENYIGIRPCDGVYGRGTNAALLYAIQAEEGMPTSVANGNCGPSTKRCLPLIPYSGGYTKNGQTYGVNYYGQVYNSGSIDKFKILLNMALYFNGYGDGTISSIIDTNIVSLFQSDYSISNTGNVDYTTWLSLLVSCGDIERSALACDCATILTQAKAATLFNNGYRYVGRYLSGTAAGGVSKALSREELQIAFNNGLNVFPIYQSSGTDINYFTYEQGKYDAKEAMKYADKLGIPSDTIIFFAVDCDPLDYQITQNIIPYFNGINSVIAGYGVGIYGTRNACSRISNLGYASNSFVSDMSTGFSGNLGFNIPSNWIYDQFTTITVGSGDGQIEIDKDGYSSNNANSHNSFNSITTAPLIAKTADSIQKIYDLAMNYTGNNVSKSTLLTLQYLRSYKGRYSNSFWGITAGEISDNFCNYVNTNYPTLPLTFFEPVKEKDGIFVEYELDHMCATLNALLYEVGEGEIPGLDFITDNFASWVGDCASFSGDIYTASDNGETNLQDWANDNICQLNDTSFDFSDYAADIDAENIYFKINSGISLPIAFLTYFATILNQDADVYTRTSTWVNNHSTGFLEDRIALLNSTDFTIYAAVLQRRLPYNSTYFAIALNAFQTYLYTEYGNGR
ncbi:MAG: DUF1906 domain-containing protein [Bacilli bacterium]|nr:DUF1906 domain-containing protein [Bacilli bacterium]